eukprot:scaffold142206_cov23-Tisochrysis_lutea.AAC.1
MQSRITNNNKQVANTTRPGMERTPRHNFFSRTEEPPREKTGHLATSGTGGRRGARTEDQAFI